MSAWCIAAFDFRVVYLPVVGLIGFDVVVFHSQIDELSNVDIVNLTVIAKTIQVLHDASKFCLKKWLN